MADSRWWIASVVCVLLMANGVTSSKEILTSWSSSFGNVADQCRNELGVGGHILDDLMNFWKEEYELVNRDLGCLIFCMATKLDLMDSDRMHHAKAHEFAKTHGADDNVAKQLVDMIHGCEKVHDAMEDNCARVLEVSKCFRTKIHELKWAPGMEVVIEEIMTAV